MTEDNPRPRPTPNFVDRVRRLAPGLAMATVIALAAQTISSQYGGPLMLYALLMGMAFNFLKDDENCSVGIQFASKSVLRFGVILLGAAVTLSEIVALGPQVALLALVAVTATIGVGWAIGRAFGLSNDHAVLSAGAVAICGASAALAIAAVLPRNERSERNLLLTIAGVTTLSTLVMVIYPWLTQTLGFDDRLAGIFLGSSIHDVAQVMGAGFMVSPEAGEIAGIVKLIRVALLVPAVLVISLVFGRARQKEGLKTGPFPLFLVGFIALMAVNSTGILPDWLQSTLTQGSRLCLAIAVAALGVRTSPKALFEVGAGPAYAMVGQTLFIGALSLGAILLFF